MSGVTILGDAGGLAPGASLVNKVILDGALFSGSNDVGFDVYGGSITIKGFYIQNFDIGIQMLDSGKANFVADSNTFIENGIGVVSSNAVPGVEIINNKFVNNGYALKNIDSGQGGAQYTLATGNDWNGDVAGNGYPVVARCTLYIGETCDPDSWLYYKWESGMALSPTLIAGFDPLTNPNELIFGNKDEHWNIAAHNWAPYKYIITDLPYDPYCGDGDVNREGEACDDGNTVNTDGCTNECTLPACGDSILQASEACDDGNTANNDGCSSTCQLRAVVTESSRRAKPVMTATLLREMAAMQPVRMNTAGTR